MLLLLLAGCSISAAIFVASEALTASARRRHSAVATVRRWSTEGGELGGNAVRPAWTERILARIGQSLLSDRLADRLPQRLAAAGLAGRVSVQAYLALRLVLVVAGVFVAFLVALAAGATVGGSMLAAVLIGLACFVLPGAAVGRRAVARRERVARALPDALDLLAVTVEAGLGLHGAIARLVECMTGSLAEEFSLVLTEIRVGESSERALKRMASRVDAPEVTSFVRSLIQSEQLGVSLGQTLRHLADDARRRRRSLAEESAAKAPVKMLIPAALFIFPALFMVILGPAVLQLGTYL